MKPEREVMVGAEAAADLASPTDVPNSKFSSGFQRSLLWLFCHHALDFAETRIALLGSMTEKKNGL